MAENERIEFVRILPDLPLNEQEFVFRETEQKAKFSAAEYEQFLRTWMFIGMKKNGRLLSFISFKAVGGECSINRVWGARDKEFILRHGLSPASALFAKLAKERKIKSFYVNATSAKGNIFFSRMLQRGYLKKFIPRKIGFGFKTTPQVKKLFTKGGVLHKF